MSTTLTLDTYLQMKKTAEELKPIFWYGIDESLPDERYIVVTSPIRYHILNSNTLTSMKQELPYLRFLHLSELKEQLP